MRARTTESTRTMVLRMGLSSGKERLEKGWKLERLLQEDEIGGLKGVATLWVIGFTLPLGTNRKCPSFNYRWRCFWVYTA
jgi:hypothetical protein